MVYQFLRNQCSENCWLLFNPPGFQVWFSHFTGEKNGIMGNGCTWGVGVTVILLVLLIHSNIGCSEECGNYFFLSSKCIVKFFFFNQISCMYKQCFSNSNVHSAHLSILWKCRPWFGRLGRGLKVRLWNLLSVVTRLPHASLCRGWEDSQSAFLFHLLRGVIPSDLVISIFSFSTDSWLWAYNYVVTFQPS